MGGEWSRQIGQRALLAGDGSSGSADGWIIQAEPWLRIMFRGTLLGEDITHSNSPVVSGADGEVPALALQYLDEGGGGSPAKSFARRPKRL